MQIIVEQVMNDTNLEAFKRIREQVFVHELGIALAPSISFDNGRATFLLARAGPDQVPVGSLCVLDTSLDNQLHQSLGLNFETTSRVARYTHLAVLKPYRGMNIPLAMMIEAHHTVIVSRQFDYTWLLFDIARAASSFLVRHFGFTLLQQTFDSEYGCRCPLVRDETALQAQQAIEQAEKYLSQCETIAA